MKILAYRPRTDKDPSVKFKTYDDSLVVQFSLDEPRPQTIKHEDGSTFWFGTSTLEFDGWGNPYYSAIYWRKKPVW